MTKTPFQKKGILIGCRNVVFAKLEEDLETATTYATEIKSAPGVIEIALTAQTTNETIGADDIAMYDVFTSQDGVEVSVTIASLGADGRTFLQGSVQDEKGVLLDGGDDIAPYVAMGFITARSDGSDDYIWLYKGKFAPGDETFRTKEQGTVNWQTPVLTGSFIPRISDKKIRAVVNTNEEKAKEILQTFFDSVYQPTMAAAASMAQNEATGEEGAIAAGEEEVPTVGE